jgi:hypothetical protein
MKHEELKSYYKLMGKFEPKNKKIKQTIEIIEQNNILQSKLEKSIALNEELVDDVEKLAYRYCNAMGCEGRYDDEIQQYQARINKLKGE